MQRGASGFILVGIVIATVATLSRANLIPEEALPREEVVR